MLSILCCFLFYGIHRYLHKNGQHSKPVRFVDSITKVGVLRGVMDDMHLEQTKVQIITKIYPILHMTKRFFVRLINISFQLQT